METAMLLANVVGCSLAGSVYALWAIKWWRRKRIGMALLHAITAVIGIGFGVGYAFIMIEHPRQPIPAAAFRPFMGFVLLAPAIARIFELREAEYREAFARQVKKRLKSGPQPREDGS